MLSLSDVEAAARLLADRLPRSPLLRDASPHDPSTPALWLKAECLMPTGSFKIRGATHAIARLDAAQRTRGVVAYSTGNHAQAVARAAQQAGIAATIVMSPDVPPAKLEATRSFGAQVVMAAPTSQARRDTAEALAAQHGACLIPPYDAEVVMAAQGCIALELLEQLGDVRPAAVFVPIGGGGLIAGIATALKAIDASIEVVGVEPELEDDAFRSWRSGSLQRNAAASASCADAIRVQCLGELTWPILQARVDRVVTVSEDEIADAAVDCFATSHLVVEAAGATALAAARREQTHPRQRQGERPLVAVLSGGNIDLATLNRLAAQAHRRPR